MNNTFNKSGVCGTPRFIALYYVDGASSTCISIVCFFTVFLLWLESVWVSIGMLSSKIHRIEIEESNDSCIFLVAD